MAKKKKTVSTREILYLHVPKGTKSWFGGLQRKLKDKRNTRVTQSATAALILGNLRKYPKLLRAALQ